MNALKTKTYNGTPLLCEPVTQRHINTMVAGKPFTGDTQKSIFSVSSGNGKPRVTMYFLPEYNVFLHVAIQYWGCPAYRSLRAQVKDAIPAMGVYHATPKVAAIIITAVIAAIAAWFLYHTKGDTAVQLFKK